MDSNILAIDGGDPVFADGPPNWPPTDPEVLESLGRCYRDGSWGRYESQWSEQLLDRLQVLSGCPNIFACSSGTIAVELALRGLDVKPNSEVILAAYDFPGNFRAIESIGAKPVIVDVVENGWVIDSDELESAIGPNTTAVIASHLHGQIADGTRIRAICEDHQIGFVEDVCQSPGAKISDQPVGSMGHVSTFSFGGSKLLTAGRGGAIATQNEELLQRIKIFSNRGNEAFPLSQIQSAVLLPQLDKLEQRNLIRNLNVIELLRHTEDLNILKPMTQILSKDVQSAFYKFPWLLDDIGSPWTRGEFIAAIQSEGVAMDAGFRGFTRRSNKRCRHHGTLINARKAAQQTLILHHPILLEPQSTIERVGSAIRKVVNSR